MYIDLRSDTVTLPTASMRAAMAAADVGDDVFGEDPTVIRLEERIARVTGKDAAVFVASGTMGNLTSLLAHCERGRSAIVGDESHVFHYEAGGASAFGGIAFHTVPTRSDGTMPLPAIEAAIRLPRDVHAAPTGVICVENTHNRCGGVVVGDDYVAEVAAIARRIGVPVHLDGARLFNASVAVHKPLTAWTQHVTTVMLSFSKGLSAPVGSVVAGPREVIARVRKARKMLGGWMRQVGVLAAAALVALDEMVPRLAEDHANARLLAEGLADLPGIQLDLSTVATNIVMFTTDGRHRPRPVDRGAEAGRRARHRHGRGAACGPSPTTASRPMTARGPRTGFARVLERLGAGETVKAQSMRDALDGRR